MYTYIYIYIYMLYIHICVCICIYVSTSSHSAPVAPHGRRGRREVRGSEPQTAQRPTNTEHSRLHT